jgi:hypothetical protein
VGDESHVDAMRAAIRGDFERLERRRGAQELMRIAEPGPGDDEGVDDAPLHEVVAEAPRSWLDRLLAR